MSVRRFLTLMTLAIAALLGRDARGQATTRPATRAALPADLEFSILTFGPGPAVYERFGHVAIRMRVPSRGFDASFDWGNFSFDDPDFLWRFVRGDNRYWMQGKPTQSMLDVYIGEWDRTVIEQRLALDERQRVALYRLLQTGDTDANRYYVYDYYRDNCATRVRDAVDVAIDGQLRPQMAAMTGHGYRWQTRRLLWVGWDNKLLATLIDFCEGPRADRGLSEWDAAFLPTELRRSLDRATIASDDGTRRPLVDRRTVLNTTKSPGNAEPSAPGVVVAWPLAIGVVGALAIVIAAHWCWPIAVVGIVAWELFAAFGGLFFTLVIAFTRHWIVAWNENFLQFTPVGLLIVASLIARRWQGLRSRAATIAAVSSVLGAAISVSHLTPQLTAPAVALSLPLHLAVWHAVRSRATRHRPSNLEGTAS